MRRSEYFEDFDETPGGWLGWMGGGGGARRLELRDGAAIVRSPWGVDFNHAPPGAGYLHLLYALLTMPVDSPAYQRFEPFSGVNRFARDGYPRDFTNARFGVRIRGDVDLKGAHLLLAIQADVGPVRTNYVLSGQPIRVGPDWREEALTLTPDPSQWTCLGTRGPGADCANYGEAPLAAALRDLNINVVLVLFPLAIVPARALPDPADLHRLRAGKDYPVDPACLPSGSVMLDWVRIEFAV